MFLQFWEETVFLLIWLYRGFIESYGHSEASNQIYTLNQIWIIPYSKLLYIFDDLHFFAQFTPFLLVFLILKFLKLLCIPIAIIHEDNQLERLASFGVFGNTQHVDVAYFYYKVASFVTHYQV